MLSPSRSSRSTQLMWFTPAPRNVTSSKGTPAYSQTWWLVFWMEWQRPTIFLWGDPAYQAQQFIAMGLV